MAEDDQATARHGGLDMEVTVEEPPARAKRASEPSGPTQADAMDPQAPAQEPAQEDPDEGSDGGDAQGTDRLTALIGKLRDKARRKGDEPASEPAEADEAPVDPEPTPEQAEKRPTVQASGFTILSYRSGPGQNDDPPVPGRQATTAPEGRSTGPEEPQEPEQVAQAPQPAEIEQPEPGMTEAPPIPADDIEASDPEDEVAIEMEEPAAEVVEPDHAPDHVPDDEALVAEEEPEVTEQVEQTEDHEGSPGFLASLRDRFSSDKEPAEEALEAEEEPEPEDEADGPSLFTRLRSKLSRSKADAIEVPTAMPAPPPTPPVATAEVSVADEVDGVVAEDVEDTEEAKDSPGLFARLTGKASKDEEPEPEQAPEVDPATDEAPAKKGGLFSRLKDKVSRSGPSVEDPIVAELGQPPTPPTGDRHPELIAAMGRPSEPTASDLESLEATIEAVEAQETPEPGPATAEEPEPVAVEAETDGEAAEKGGFFSRLKDKVTGSDEGPEDQVADEPERDPVGSTPIEHPHEPAVDGAPEVPPTGDRHPELITAMSTDSRADEEPEEPDPEAVDAETEEEAAEKTGGLFSRLKEKVAGSDEAPGDQVADDPEATEAPEAPEAEALEAQEPPSVEADEEPSQKGGLFSRLKGKVSGAEEEAEEEPEVDEAPEPSAVEAEGPELVQADEPATEEPEAPTPEEAGTSEPSELGSAVAEVPEQGPGAVEAEEDPVPPEPTTAETATDEPEPTGAPEADEDGDLPYDEIVRRVESLLDRRREDPEKSAAREKVRILAGGSKR